MAFERPIDMIPPIWLWARRCMNQKKPTRITIGSRNGSRLMNQLGLGVVYSTSTLVLAQRREVGLGDPALERAGGAELVAPGVVGVLALDRAVGVVDLDAGDVAGATEVMKSA